MNSLRVAPPRGRSRLLRQGVPFATAVMAALAMGLLYLEIRTNALSLEIVRALCVVPVALAAYRRDGLLPGMVMAGFFSSVFLWEMATGWRTAGFSATTVELFISSVFLFLVAVLTSGLAASRGTRETLVDTASDLEGLLTRASDLGEVVAFLRRDALREVDAESAILLLKNPLDGHWGTAMPGHEIPLAFPGEGASHALNLAQWLVEIGRPQVLSDLDADPRFVLASAEGIPQPRSLLARPMRASDGSLVAILVLLNARSGAFAWRDQWALDGLVEGAEQALEQAGLYARTDRALARRVAQLGALQRAGQELNTALYFGSIARRTLDCALEISGAQAGLVALEFPRLSPAIEAAGISSDPPAIRELFDTAARLPGPALDPPLPSGPGHADAGSRLLAPIRRGGQLLGLLFLESSTEGAFDERDLLVVAALASHAAIAAETARLFDEVRRERQRADQVIRSMTDGLLTVDGRGTITGANQAAEILTGRSHTGLVSCPLCDVLDCGTGPEVPLQGFASTVLREHRPAHLERWSIRRPDGSERVLDLSGAPLPGPDGNDSEAEAVILLRDVTAREELDRFQRELVAAFAHELRTPLTNINTAIELLLSGEEGNEARAHLEILRSQSQRLASFAARTLDVSRLDSGDWPLEPRPVPAALLAGDVVAAWRAAAPGRPFRIESPHRSPWVWADEQAAGIVLDNLLDNALKYSPPQMEVLVTVADGPEGYVTLAVHDGGPGIPPEHRTRVFDRFYRVDGSDAQRVYGHGLGLHIAKGLVESMGGRIWAEAPAVGGTRVAFTLPVWREET